MAVELATAYVTLVPSLRGAQGAIAKELGGVDVTAAGRDVGNRMGNGIAGSLKSLIGPAIALAGAVGVGKFVADSVKSLGRIEQINTQTATALKSTGAAAWTTNDAIESLAGKLEDLTGTEAESIQQGANLMLTFKNVQNSAGEGNDIFDQSVVAMTDMARAMGTDVKSGAVQLGKALNDPIKGVASLSKVGITFSEDQKAMIASLVETNDLAGAQKIILGELNSQFGGSAAAYADTYAGRMELLGHAVGTFGEAMSAVLMPALKSLAIVGADALNWAATLFGSDEYAAWGERLGAGITGVVDLLKGDFTPALAFAFGVEDDTKLLATFVNLRTTASEVFAQVSGGFSAMVAAFKDGGSDVTSSGFAGFLETVGLVARSLWDALSPVFATLGPQVLLLAQTFSPLGLVFKTLEPILPTIAAALVEVSDALGGALTAVLPTVVGLVQTLAGVMSGVLAAVLPTIVTMVTLLAGVAATLVPPFAEVATTIVGAFSGALSSVLPQVASLATTLISALMPVLPVIAGLLGTVATMLAGTLGGAVSQLMPVMVDLVGNVLDALVPVLPVIGTLLGVVAGIFGDLLGAVVPILPPLAGLVSTLVDALVPVLPTLTGLLTTVATTLGGALGKAVGSLLPVLSDLVGTVFAAMVPLLPVIGSLLDAVAVVIGVLVEALVPLLPPILLLVETLFGALAPLLPTVADLLALVAQVVVDLVLALAPLLPTLTNLISVGLNVLVMALNPLIGIIGLVANILITGLMVAIKAIMPTITGVISVVSTLAQILTTVLAVAFQALAAVVTTVWDAIFAVINTVWGWIQSAIFAPMNLAVGAVGLAFSAAGAVIAVAWDGIQSAASSAWTWIKDNVFKPFSDGIAALGTAFGAAKDVIGTAWDAIQSAALIPVNFIIEKVYTGGIKALFDTVAEKLGLSLRLPTVKPIGQAPPTVGRPINAAIRMASGGVLPGWTPGKDVHEFFSATGGRLSLSGGEAIMRPEFTRAVGGPAGVARINAAARTGQAFALGGVWNWVGDKLGDAWDFTKDAASAIGNFMKDPIKGALEVIAKPVQAILSGIGGGDVGQIMAGIPSTVLTGLVEAAKSIFGPARDSDGGTTGPSSGTTGMGYQAMIQALAALAPGTAVTSSYRPGAMTAVGTKSYHGMGRAIDMAPSLALFDRISAAYPNSAELLYSPAGARQIIGKGQRGNTSGITNQMHYNHVHWAMKNGGVLPTLYDEGGWLPPGRSVVENRTGKPEPILNPAQWASIDKGESNSLAGRTLIVRVGAREFTGYVEDVADDRIDARQRELSGYRGRIG